MKQQLHRSLTFWSGILIMAFIAWAWRDSLRYHSAMRSKDTEFFSACGGCGLGHLKLPFRLWLIGKSQPDHTREPISASDIEFRTISLPTVVSAGKPAPFPPYEDPREYLEARYEMTHRSSLEWIFFLPYWLILLAVAFPWLGLLLWRARRRKRAHAITP